MNLQAAIFRAQCAKRTPDTRRWPVKAPEPILEDVNSAEHKLDELRWKHNAFVSAEASWRVEGRITVTMIKRVAARYYNLDYAHMWSHRRTANLVRPRQIAMYLSRSLTAASLPEIGRRMGGRDHTTVLHGYRKITRLLETDVELREQIAELRDIISPSSHPDQLRLPLSGAAE